MTAPSKQRIHDLLQQLGLSPDASLHDVKQAYRQRVKSLHPDKNPGQDTTAAFQQLQHTYQTLVQYYQYGAQPPPVQPPSHHTKEEITTPVSFANQAPKPPPPIPNPVIKQAIVCRHCRKDRQGLRYRCWQKVTGLIIITRHKLVSGIWCQHCSLRLALKINIWNLLLGWWSITGPWHTIRSWWTNTLGGKTPLAENSKLEYRLALQHIAKSRFNEAIGHLYWLKHYCQNQAMQDKVNQLLHQLGDPSEAVAQPPESTHFFKSQFILLSLMILFISLPILIWQQAFEPLALVSKPPISANPIAPEAQHQALYRSHRLGSHYTLDAVALLSAPDIKSAIITRVGQYAPVNVVSKGPQGWVTLSTTKGLQGFVAEQLIGFGNHTIAKRYQCQQYPGPRPFNGELLGQHNGKKRLSIENPHTNDAIVLFRQQNKTVQLVYIYAQQQIHVQRLPNRIDNIIIRHGQFYNHACRTFTANLEERKEPLTIISNQQKLQL
ncbi:DnaJ domain-containing protein [Zooshikella marina]|uniref:DnaJ domain-containing protein n=1 Tax=Zooshikella ganghwensis TaxID=202772 RepID=UPI001BB0D532|nr:DnaJ domain-containing protein [Zooshikella ganghwensis]MBU2706738.1 DnaJ domain-containing protein [Zooshikella ganghwensis]